MKAMVLEGPNTSFVKKEVPDPIAGPGEAVAKVISCGSGLTIQHVKMGRTPATFPRTLGHEITGEIVEIGPGVNSRKVGDPVTLHFTYSADTAKNSYLAMNRYAKILAVLWELLMPVGMQSI